MTTPAPPRKPTYRTFVAELHVAAPRDTVWARLLELLDAGEVGPASSGDLPETGSEDVLSFEPPWRRVARLSIEGVPFAEHTVALRDDSDSCHLVWAYLVEPPSAGGDEAFERVLDGLANVLRASCERVATAVEQR